MLDTQAQTYYCGVCWKYIGATGKRVPYTSDAKVIVWTECAWCMERRLKQEAAEEERQRREEERRRPRVCELDECNERFTPSTPWQAYCCDEHRWQGHRRRKTHRTAA